MAPKKRKKESQMPETVEESCIIHFPSSKSRQFIHLNEERLNKLKKVADIKQRMPSKLQGNLKAISWQLPVTVQSGHGYHRSCYQLFTMKTNQLESKEQDKTTPKLKRMCSEKRDQKTFFQNCIFCEKESTKKVKKAKYWTNEFLQNFDYDECATILKKAEENQDEKLLIRIRGFDLSACGAKYHKTCRKDYLRNRERWKSKDEEAVQSQQVLEKDHS